MATNLAESRPVFTARRRYERPSVRPLDRSRWRSIMAVRAFSDACALGTALYVATATRFGKLAIRSQGAYGRYLWLWLLLWWGCLAAVGAYERHRTDNHMEELRAVVHGITLGEALAITGSFFVKFQLSRIWSALVWVLALAAVLAGRSVIRLSIRALRRRGHLRRRAVIIGADASGRALAEAIAHAPSEGVDVVGLVALNELEDARSNTGVIGGMADLREIVIGSEATEVLCAPTAAAKGRFADIVSALDGVPVELRMAPGVEGFLHSRLAVHPLGDKPLIAIERVELRPAQRVVKRALDLVLAIPLLIVAAPVMVACAVAVRMTSRGPAFFRQTRTGANGREFTVIKLRSMVADAEKQKSEMRARNESVGLLFKMREDPRVTRVGGFLRKTSLDELPQLFNVIKGDMSLVGPRPPLPDEVARYNGPLRRRLLVKPGITGLWQVSGRHELSFEDYVRHDLLYVQSWSIALDLVILLRTIPAVFSRRGAY